MRTLFAPLVVLLLALPSPACSADARLSQRLEPALAQAVQAVADSASAAGLPSEPLVATALEGHARGASAERIVTALRRQAAALDVARRSLGREAPTEELVLAAGALMAGTPADSLARLAAVRRGGTRAPALVLIGDLAARGVSPVAASGVVLDACRAGARDAELVRLGQAVQRDIEQGVAAGSSARLRTRALLTRLASPSRGAAR